MPNFVFIMTDTQGADVIGCYGQPGVGTEHLDGLAEEGIRFDRAYTTCPVCSPARSGIFTGLMPSKAGPFTNNLSLFADVRHMGQYFQAGGYDTAYIGKWHLDGHDYFGDGRCPEGFDSQQWYDGLKYLMELEAESESDGRDLVRLWREGLKTTEQLEAQAIDARFTWAHRISDRAIAWLDQRKQDKPFLLVASYDEPHHPEVCPPEYVRRFEKFEFDLGPAAHDDLSDKPIHQQQWAASRSRRGPAAQRIRRPLYFGCNSFVDDEIGRLITAARQVPDTWIIFTSDHGDMMGRHRLNSKGPAMYDPITRIPLIIRPPVPLESRADPTLVSHIDLLPTMLELAGLNVPPILDGQSFSNRLTTEPPAPQGRDIVMEFHRHSLPHDSWGGFIPIRAVVSEHWKLVINLHQTDELYDLKEDPGEVNNRIDDPALQAHRDDLHDRLLDRMDRMRDPMRGPCWEARSWRKDAQRGFKGEYRMKPDDGVSPLPRVYRTGRPV